jgi:hypothetical protein
MQRSSVVFKSNPKTKECKMTNVNNTNVIDNAVTNEVNAIVSALRIEYADAERKSAEARRALYELIADCVNFYHFLRESVEYEIAFKSIIDFEIRKQSALTTLIAKMIVGASNKNAYAYAKTMDAVIAEQSSDKSLDVAAWIEARGGVNKIVHNMKSSTDSETLRKQEIEAGRYANLFGVSVAIDAFECDELQSAFSEKSEVVVLLSRDAKTRKLSVVFFDNDDDSVEAMYRQFGKFVMKQDSYAANKKTADEAIRRKNESSLTNVLEALRQIDFSATKRNESHNDESENLDMCA